MTVQAVTRAEVVGSAGSGDGSVFLFTWASMANGDSGEPVSMPAWADRCVQVVGTFGAAGSVSWEGSNDKTNWATLDNPQGSGLTFTSAGLKQVLELPVWIRPHVTGGDGTTAIVGTMLVRRGNPLRT